ncbi:MAG TPA: four helix bundle protein [Tepidisphaeraceae bacterium]|nr:four helix bundle protein [Tepidisphaeraceae bacterium]
MKDAIRDFTDLVVWQKAIRLGKLVYQLTKEFPVEERYGLTSQVRRAAVSVASNIAEGHARQGKEFSYFLSISRGSLAETESQLLFAVELGYVDLPDIVPVRELVGELHRMMASLSSKVSRK